MFAIRLAIVVISSLLVVGLLMCTSNPKKPEPLQRPLVTTGPADSISSQSAKLSGTINPRGSRTFWYFRYGDLNAANGRTPDRYLGDVGYDSVVHEWVSSLTPGTDYFFEVIAFNAEDSVHGGNQEFTTTSPPTLGVNPTALAFAAFQASSLPNPKSIDIANIGAGGLDTLELQFTVWDSSWLALSTEVLATDSGEIIRATVTITDNVLPTADYEDTIVVTSALEDIEEQRILVTYSINNAAPICEGINDTMVHLCAETEFCLPIAVMDPGEDVVTCSVISGPGSVVDGQWCYTPNGTETANVTIRCEDGAGGECQESFSVVFDVDEPPDIVCPDTAEFVCPGDVVLCFAVDLGSPIDDIDTVYVSNADGIVDLSTGEVCVDFPDFGWYEVEVVVMDTCGSTVRCTVSVDYNLPLPPYDPPSIICPDTLDVFQCVGEPVCFDVTITPTAHDIDTVYVESPNGTVNMLTGEVCSQLEPFGINDIVIVAVDSCGAQASCTTHVNYTVDGPPVCIHDYAETFVLCEPKEANRYIPANDAEEEELTCTQLSGPGVLTDCLWSWTPTSDTTVSMVYQAMDSCGQFCIDSMVFHVFIDDPPVFDPAGPWTYTVCSGDTVCDTITATDDLILDMVQFPILEMVQGPPEATFEDLGNGSGVFCYCPDGAAIDSVYEVVFIAYGDPQVSECEKTDTLTVELTAQGCDVNSTDFTVQVDTVNFGWLGVRFPEILYDTASFLITNNTAGDRTLTFSKRSSCEEFTILPSTSIVLPPTVVRVNVEFAYGGSTPDSFSCWIDIQGGGFCDSILVKATVSDWQTLHADTTDPVGRANHTAILYDDGMYIFGGLSKVSGPAVVLDDLHRFDLINFEWQKINTASLPAKVRSHVAVRGSDDKMWVHGGRLQNGFLDGATRFLDLPSPNWSALGKDTIPRTEHTAVYSRRINHYGGMFVYGGITSTPLRDLWQLTDQELNWIQMSNAFLIVERCTTLVDYDSIVCVDTSLAQEVVCDTFPAGGIFRDSCYFDTVGIAPARWGASSIVYPAPGVWTDGPPGIMLVFGGASDVGGLMTHSDVWAYTLPDGLWVKYTSDGDGPSNRFLHTAVYNPYRGPQGSMIIYGGLDQVGGSVLGDVWSYDIASRTWTQLLTVGPPRKDHSAVFYDGWIRGMVVFGGDSGEDNHHSDVLFLPMDAGPATR